MKEIHYLKKPEELKALSDPVRIEILHYLVEGEYTGQQLARILSLARSKIHYHLKELKKYGIVEIVRQEEKRGILQKFYRAVAKSIIPDEGLFPVAADQTPKKEALAIVAEAKAKILRTPADCFFNTQERQTEICEQHEFQVKEEDFISFKKILRGLIRKLAEKNQREQKGRRFYLNLTAFEVEPEDQTETLWRD